MIENDHKIRRSLKRSLFNDIFANITGGFSDTFIAPYALAMRASPSLIALLVAVPSITGSCVQLASAALTERLGSRKRLIVISIFCHILMWIPLIAVPYVVPSNTVIVFIFLYAIYVSFGATQVPAWSSLMADLVPKTKRGTVFGWRNRLFGIINASSMLIAGYILSRYKGNPIAGFTVIFSVAFVARIISWYFVTRMYEPPLSIRQEHKFTMVQFLRRVPKSNFGRFVVFVASMNFAVNISGPFFAVLMLKDLGFGYLKYTVITTTATLTILFMMKAWGRQADQVGNRKVLRFTSYFLPFMPLLWLFSHDLWYLIAVQVFAGLFWSGFNLSASNFIYDAVTPEKRTRCIAYFNVINGLAIFSGASLGGLLIKVVPAVCGYKILSIFVISSVLRMCIVVFLPRVKEVRRVRDVSNRDLLYGVLGIRPLFSLSDGKE